MRSGPSGGRPTWRTTGRVQGERRSGSGLKGVMSSGLYPKVPGPSWTPECKIFKIRVCIIHVNTFNFFTCVFL